MECGISDVHILETKTFRDERGVFVNGFRREEEAWIETWGERKIEQINISTTLLAGTVRGMHMQREPDSEAKVVQCLAGRVWDVVVDLREASDTFGKWYGIELSGVDNNAIIIPEGCAHGFQALEDRSTVLYMHSTGWRRESETGVRFDDPSLCIEWPMTPRDLSKRDQSLPFLTSIK